MSRQFRRLQILVSEIERFNDPGFAEEWSEAADAVAENINEINDDVLARHATASFALEQRRAELSAEADRRLDDFRRLVDERLADLRRLADEHLGDLARQGERLMTDLAEHDAAIEQDLNDAAPDAVSDFEWPEPPEGWDNPLFDSMRDYVTQADRYKLAQGKRIAFKRAPKTYRCVQCGASFQAVRPSQWCSDGCRNKPRVICEAAP
jgi:hypothetical protein